jgi:hypothetical protein
MRKDPHNNLLVGKKRPNGQVWRVMHDDKCKDMLIKWLKGERSRDLVKEYKITPTIFGHQKYYHIKRLASEFMQSVVLIFQDGGTRALIRRYDLDPVRANKLVMRSQFYLKHRRRQIDKLEIT